MLTTGEDIKVVSDTVEDNDQEANVLLVTEAEWREDAAAGRDTDDLINTLTMQATPIRNEMSKLEDATAGVSDPELLNEAGTLLGKLRVDLCRLVSLATHGSYTTEEVWDWFAATMRHGGSFPRVRGDLIRDLVRIKQVPVAPLRESFVDYVEANPGVDYSEILTSARDHLAEMERADDEDYGSAAWRGERPVNEMQKHLGMQQRKAGNGSYHFVTFISYERAVALSRAIGLNPIQVGV
jgi:hypothetical protein